MMLLIFLLQAGDANDDVIVLCIEWGDRQTRCHF